jgi:pimeloyl-ACP methyl ester carboxylesterase
MRRGFCLSILALLLLAAACAGTAPSPTPSSSRPWIEEEVTFSFAAQQMYGVLTLPTGGGPYPAIVLVSGSVSTATGVRSGASSPYFVDHARKMVLNGFAVLRYDPPGVGRSTGEGGFESLDLRTEEAVAALQYLRSRPDIHADRVGLMGNSQGAWVIAMAAARYPQDVAFIISVSGSGVSVAEQQIHSIV